MNARRISWRPLTWAVGGLTICAALLAGCAQAGGTPAPSDPQQSQLEQFAQLRAAREAKLAAMSGAELAAELEADSERGLEPFNSTALREMVERGEDAASELAKLLIAEDRRSLLGLLAVREMSRQVYGSISSGLKVSILIDALAKSQYFNTWGIPDLYWEDAAQAIIDEGRDAEPLLRRLLDDKRPAPLWGDEEYVHFEQYQYRVADYALALILAIRNDETPIPVDPAERDRLIAGL